MTTRWLNASQQRAWRAFLMGSTALMEQLDRDLRERHDLSLPEYEVLVRLSESPDWELRMAELADSVQNSRSRMTHTVARMERAGLVVRRSCASDRRGVLAALTEAGYRKLVKAAPDHVESVRAALIDVLAPRDLEVIGRAFGEVLAGLGRPAAVGSAVRERAAPRSPATPPPAYPSNLLRSKPVGLAFHERVPKC